MRIGLIADTHNLLRPEALAALQGVDHLIHAGDIGGPHILTELERIAPLSVVRGNNDQEAWADDIPETLTMGLSDFFRQVANFSETWARSIGDGKVDDQELAEIQQQVFRGIQGLLGMYRRA